MGTEGQEIYCDDILIARARMHRTIYFISFTLPRGNHHPEVQIDYSSLNIVFCKLDWQS